MLKNTGLVVTTYNSEKWFDELYQTLPLHVVQDIIVVNGGKEYKKKYSGVTWLQHKENLGAAQSRIDGIKFLQNKNIQHIFVIEDDMLIKNENIFEAYINASIETGLKYFCFCSNASGTGAPGSRTPGEIVEYKNTKIAFYREMNNEFTYHHVDIFKKLGYYNTSYRHLWDVEFVYRVLTSEEFGCGFRYFPDIVNSDMYIKNHPESINNSRTNKNNSRDKELPEYLLKFQNEHGYHVGQVPILDKQAFTNKLKYLYKAK